MPYLVKKIKDKFRVVDKNTGKIAKNASGTAVDGGGHSSEAKARKQQSALNISYARERGADIPANPKEAGKRMARKAKYS